LAVDTDDGRRNIYVAAVGAGLCRALLGTACLPGKFDARARFLGPPWPAGMHGGPGVFIDDVLIQCRL